MRIRTLAVATLAALPSVWAAATVINVDLAHSGDPVYAGTAAAPDTGTTWNAVADVGDNHKYVFASGLKNSAGVTTAASLTIGYPAETNSVVNWYGGASTTNALLYDALKFGYASVPVAVAGLLPSRTYDVYLYDFSWETHAINVQTGSGTVTALADSLAGVGASTIGAAGEGHTWLTFAADTDGFGNLAFNVNSPSGEVMLDGLQVAEVPVPEPASLSLLGLAGLVLLRRR